jgi:hypothetical protein
MNRSAFLSGMAAAVAAGTPLWALAGELVGSSLTTQHDLFAALPPPAAKTWTRLIMGSGAIYQKQIGTGVESEGNLHFYETEVGSPGGSCNPATMRKAYLKAQRFGSLLDEYPLLTNIGRTDSMIYRYGGAGAGNDEPGDSTLLLLDEKYLYDTRPVRIVSVRPERLHVANAVHDTTHIVAEFTPARTSKEVLRRIELWTTPDLPFGVARYRATVHGLDQPFELHVYAHGRAFASDLQLPLARVEAMTQNGQYGRI